MLVNTHKNTLCFDCPSSPLWWDSDISMSIYLLHYPPLWTGFFFILWNIWLDLYQVSRIKVIFLYWPRDLEGKEEEIRRKKDKGVSSFQFDTTFTYRVRFVSKATDATNSAWLSSLLGLLAPAYRRTAVTGLPSSSQGRCMNQCPTHTSCVYIQYH